MSMSEQTGKRVALVCDRIKALALASNDDASMLSDALDAMLDELHYQDAFGTEGQSDPRGDFRIAVWSMYSIQGIDD